MKCIAQHLAHGAKYQLPAMAIAEIIAIIEVVVIIISVILATIFFIAYNMANIDYLLFVSLKKSTPNVKIEY